MRELMLKKRCEKISFIKTKSFTLREKGGGEVLKDINSVIKKPPRMHSNIIGIELTGGFHRPCLLFLASIDYKPSHQIRHQPLHTLDDERDLMHLQFLCGKGKCRIRQVTVRIEKLSEINQKC